MTNIAKMVCGLHHYSDVIMGAMASQIIGVSIVYLTVRSGVDQGKQSPVSLAFVMGIHRWPVNSHHKGFSNAECFYFDDVVMTKTKVIWPRVVLVSCGTLWLCQDDVMTWKYFPCCWPFVRGIHRSPMDSPHTKGQQCKILDAPRNS